jgi:hypothetical protein
MSAAKKLNISDKVPLADIEQQLQKEKADLASVKAKVSDLNNQLEIQANRPDTVHARLIAANKQQVALIE